MPIALVSQAIGNLCNVFNSIILRWTDDYATKKGNYNGVVFTHWLSGMITVVRRFLLVLFAYYLGGDAVGNLINAIPEFVTNGMAARCWIITCTRFCDVDAYDN